MSQNPIYPVLAYCASSILMTVTNKLVLSSFDFKMNFLFLSFQSIGCILFLQLFTAFKLTKHRNLNSKDVKLWLKVTFSLVAMIYSGSKALQYLSVPIFTIFKNLTIILVAYIERYVLGGSPVSAMILTSFLFMVLSSLVAGYGDITGKPIVKNNASFIVSYGWMVINCLTSAGFTLMMKFNMKKYYPNHSIIDLLSIPILLIMSAALEREEGARTYQKYFTDDGNQDEFHRLLYGIVVSSICTFAISFSTAWCVRVTGPTTYSMVGALNKLPIAVFGMIFFDDAVINFASISGLLMAFFAGALYSYAKSQPQTAPNTYSQLESQDRNVKD
ncbi:GDP-mannose transporter into the lumen of the Golgi [Globomyces sp. JEL0801]|nr:GDP-mannose transporter into the lumen of the Golgi [Globomyces sp. JEL0801]